MNEHFTLGLRNACGLSNAHTAKNAGGEEHLLVAMAKSGDTSAFGTLYQLHCSKTYRVVHRILRNEHDAEDTVQRTFQRAFVNLARFREDSSFSTWVTRIAINEALMLLRKRRHSEPFSEEGNDDTDPHSSLNVPDVRPTPEQAFGQAEIRRVVLHAISKLRSSLRTVALLREVQGLTSAETARRLGLSVAAVKARTFHARRHLRRLLQHKLDWVAPAF